MHENIFSRVVNFVSGFIHVDELSLFASHKEKPGNQNKRFCPVTRLDISMQRPNSKFLSSTGVKWYYYNDRHTYLEKLEPRVNPKWRNREPDARFREIAHSIRNRDSNPRNNTRRAIQKILEEKNTLFNNLILIDSDKIKEAGGFNIE